MFSSAPPHSGTGGLEPICNDNAAPHAPRVKSHTPPYIYALLPDYYATGNAGAFCSPARQPRAAEKWLHRLPAAPACG